MPSLLPTPEPADPVEGQPGHFEHSNWLKASVKALDSGVVHKSGDTMTGDLSVTRGAGDGLLKAGARAGGAAIFATAVPESVTPGSLTIWATKLLLWNGAETPTDANSAATKGYVDQSKFLQPAPPAGDANWFMTPGFYYTQGQTVSGLPAPDYWGFLLVFAGAASEALQVFIKGDAPQLGVWYRSRMRSDAPGTWSAWHHILPAA